MFDRKAFCAVATHFNPMKYQRRRDLLRLMASRMRRQRIRLFIVEMLLGTESEVPSTWAENVHHLRVQNDTLL